MVNRVRAELDERVDESRDALGRAEERGLDPRGSGGAQVGGEVGIRWEALGRESGNTVERTSPGLIFRVLIALEAVSIEGPALGRRLL